MHQLVAELLQMEVKHSLMCVGRCLDVQSRDHSSGYVHLNGLKNTQQIIIIF